jgi:hypothetical protein
VSEGMSHAACSACRACTGHELLHALGESMRRASWAVVVCA